MNDNGIAFTGRAALAKETRIVDHAVLRTEVRDAQFEVMRLDFRIRDHASHTKTPDPTAIFSATDRVSFVQNTIPPILFGLTPAEVVERKPLEKILAPQELLPKKVHLDDHKIFRMMCITSKEVKEVIKAVEDRFRRAVPPPDDAAFNAYKESLQYIDDIENGIEPNLQLDMAPNEFGLLTSMCATICSTS